MVMIIHRARRDIQRCRRKYGDAWTQYEKEVPYLFIPVSVASSLFPMSVQANRLTTVYRVELRK
jgi:hypothetical protein